MCVCVAVWPVWKPANNLYGCVCAAHTTRAAICMKPRGCRGIGRISDSNFTDKKKNLYSPLYTVGVCFGFVACRNNFRACSEPNRVTKISFGGLYTFILIFPLGKYKRIFCAQLYQHPENVVEILKFFNIKANSNIMLKKVEYAKFILISIVSCLSSSGNS